VSATRWRPAGHSSRPGYIPPRAGTGCWPVRGTYSFRPWWLAPGVTLLAVATSLEIPVRDGQLRAEATLTSGARSGWPRTPRSASPPSTCRSTATPTPPRPDRHLAPSDRALLRRLPEPDQLPRGGHERDASLAGGLNEPVPAGSRAPTRQQRDPTNWTACTNQAGLSDIGIGRDPCPTPFVDSSGPCRRSDGGSSRGHSAWSPGDRPIESPCHGNVTATVTDHD
jgi:hypothetical protein